MSPDSIVFEVVTAPWKRTFPDVSASMIATCVIVPQFAVAAGNVIVALVEAEPPLASANVAVWRAYEPPLTSEVNVPDSRPSSAVHKPTYSCVAGV